MKLLVLGDAGCHSGFAQVVHNVFERLARDHGHEVHVLAVNYKGDPWDTPLRLYVPNFNERHDILGQSRVIELLGKLMPDAVVFVQDPQVVLNILANNPWDKDQVLWRGMTARGYVYKPPIIGYLAVDGYENPRSWDVLAERVTRVAMSHHGQAAMPEAPVIWHGVDTSVYHPRDKAEAKRELGFDPDRTLVLRVDKNSWRKDYPATWRALRPVLRRHPEVDVHFHCRSNASDGYDLANVRWNDEDIRERVTLSPDLGGFTGWPEERLATLFAAADLFVSTSWGEGFGLTLLQAAASGTAIVAQDCSAVPEVVGPGGILVKPRDRVHVPMGQMQCLPDVDKFSYWIEHLVSSPKQREALARAGVEHAAKFSWDVASDKFAALIESKVAESVAARSVEIGR